LPALIRIYTLAWLGLMVIGFANGVIRQVSYRKWVGELPAHQISTVTSIVFFGLAVWLLERRWPLDSNGQALTIGLIWVGLTVAFEFLFMHYVRGILWSRLLHDYNVLEGRVWVFVLLWVLLAPLVIHRIRS
jgi:hypothetical protein